MDRQRDLELLLRSRMPITPHLDPPKGVLRIHLESRGQAPDPGDVRELAEKTAGFSGAEIEQAIVSSLDTAHAQQAPLSKAHLLHALLRHPPRW